MILYGTTRTQSINAYTWGNYLAFDLESSYTYVKVATGGQAKVQAEKLLDVNATSKGSVGYRGNPEQKKIKTSVGGEVNQLTE